MNQAFMDSNGVIFADIESTRIWHIGRLKIEELNEIEQARFSGFVLMALFITEIAYFQARNDQLDKQDSERIERIASWFAEQPGFQSLWPGLKYNRTDDYQIYFDSLISRNLT